MKHKLIVFIIILLAGPFTAFSQQTNNDSLAKEVNSLKKDMGALKRLKVSGYVQPQFQVADSAGQSSAAGGNFAPGTDKRFMIRRGRLKVQYTSAPNAKGISLSQYVVQIDGTEKGVAFRDVYVRITDPWTGWFSVTGGMFNNPFGYECQYSSSLRESPERGRMSQLHFPNEREIGGMLTIQAPSSSKWKWIRLDAGIFNGNASPSAGGDVSDFDKRKDFSGRLSVNSSCMKDKLKYQAGVSYYDGGYRIDSVNVYTYGTDPLGAKGYVIDSKASDNGAIAIANRDYTTRIYTGADAQISYEWLAGVTTLRGEFITGDQPGLSNSQKSPNDKNAITKDTYQRKFNGAYFYFIQDIGKTKLQAVVKYDWYDPNTDVEGDDLGKSLSDPDMKATNEYDVRFDTWGFGLNYAFDSHTRIMAYYDMVTNETSQNLKGYENDREDDVFTLRLQVKF